MFEDPEDMIMAFLEGLSEEEVDRVLDHFGSPEELQEWAMGILER